MDLVWLCIPVPRVKNNEYELYSQKGDISLGALGFYNFILTVSTRYCMLWIVLLISFNKNVEAMECCCCLLKMKMTICYSPFEPFIHLLYRLVQLKMLS